jgi:hypothetical protein
MPTDHGGKRRSFGGLCFGAAACACIDISCTWPGLLHLLSQLIPQFAFLFPSVMVASPSHSFSLALYSPFLQSFKRTPKLARSIPSKKHFYGHQYILCFKVWLAGPVLIVVGSVLCGKVSAERNNQPN